MQALLRTINYSDHNGIVATSQHPLFEVPIPGEKSWQLGGKPRKKPVQDFPGPQNYLAQIANRYPHNLPASLSVLIGREIESRELISYCAHPDIRLITIYGLGVNSSSAAVRFAVEQGLAD